MERDGSGSDIVVDRLQGHAVSGDVMTVTQQSSKMHLGFGQRARSVLKNLKTGMNNFMQKKDSAVYMSESMQR